MTWKIGTPFNPQDPLAFLLFYLFCFILPTCGQNIARSVGANVTILGPGQSLNLFLAMHLAKAAAVHLISVPLEEFINLAVLATTHFRRMV